jgi:hypothetical protein
MSGASFLTEDAWVNTTSIIPDPYPKLAFVIQDFHFYPPRPCVAKCIAQPFPGNPIDLVP